jgi:ribonuclease BN (tRNA processing enzyme)
LLATLPAAVISATRLRASGRASGADTRARLVLLGTGGGPSPKPERSAPAQAIVVGGAVYVIDCGDGVARQYVRAGLRFSDLAAVFVTHQHSDHNADYGNLFLLGWTSGLSHAVPAVGPPPLARMTQQFLAMQAYDIGTRIGDEGRPPLASLIRAAEIETGGLIHEDARVKVTAALNRHPPVVPSFAYRFETADRSIVISGDTNVSDAVIALAKGADVLVHEVMYVPAIDRLFGTDSNARRLREHLLASHTSTEDVGKVAAAAGVKTLVLSHFVPGADPTITDAMWLEGVRRHFHGEVLLGRDLQVI